MAYENTLQAAALSIMANKQVAAAAIQGKFSAEGLAAMAKGVDARILLAKKLSEDDNSSAEELSSMFDVLSAVNAAEEGDEQNYVPPMIYFELMGADYEDDMVVAGETPGNVLFDFDLVAAPKIDIVVEDTPERKSRKKTTSIAGQIGLFGEGGIPVINDPMVVPLIVQFRRKKPLAVASGQLRLF